MNFRQWLLNSVNQKKLVKLTKDGVLKSGINFLLNKQKLCALYQKYKHDVWLMLDVDARLAGVPVLAYVEGLSTGKMIHEPDHFECLLVLHVVKKIAAEVASGSYAELMN